MALKIVWTKRSILHLEAELDYYGKISHILAKELTLIMTDGIKKLSEMPGISRPGKKIGIRKFIIDKSK